MSQLSTSQMARLEEMLQQYHSYEQQLVAMVQQQQWTQYRTLLQKKAVIERQVKLYKSYKTLQEQIRDLAITAQETPALASLAQTEVKALQQQLTDVATKIRQFNNPTPQTGAKHVIMEINGATGGEEANIFAADLFRMYSRYAERQKWKIKVISSNLTEAGGVTALTFKVSGQGVAAKLQFEAGAHRVQRVPKTEHKGRVHTSVATVAVLPEVSPVAVDIKTKDLRIDTYRASSAGGQHVNVTDSAVRITHLPTGIVATSQDGRSQHDNRSLAMEHLRAKIFNFLQDQLQQKTNQLRRKATGAGRRNEKIRTYNFPQNRLTDHRLNRSWNKLLPIVDGHLDDVIAQLQEQQIAGEA